MSNQPLYPTRSLRAPGPEWAGFGVAAQRQDTDRNKTLNRFIDWVLHRPDVPTPERPPVDQLAAWLADAAAKAADAYQAAIDAGLNPESDAAKKLKRQRDDLATISEEVAARARHAAQ